MSALASARSVLRSSTIRVAASEVSTCAIPARGSAFSLPKQEPLSRRMCRPPIEISSVCVESLMPYHTATPSSLLHSMLSVNRSIYGYLEATIPKTT